MQDDDTVFASPQWPLLPSDLTKRYEAQGRLGRGAMGTVVKAIDVRLRRPVAIKLLALADSNDPEIKEALARFRVEAASAAGLTHPNIVAVYDYGENADTAWIVMEFIDGRSLKEWLETGTRLPLPDIVRIMGQMLDALAYAHRSGVIHRDIKPANLMLKSDGTVKLVDFGIAKIERLGMTQVGMVMGTPGYMAPEQFLGGAVDARADLWSAGVILYQLLTGKKPFDGAYASMMHKVLNLEPTMPSALSDQFPKEFDAVIARALAKQPADRFLDATELAEAIRSAELEAGDRTHRQNLGSDVPDADDTSEDIETGGATTPWRISFKRVAIGVCISAFLLSIVGYILLGSGNKDRPPPKEPVSIHSEPNARTPSQTPSQTPPQTPPQIEPRLSKQDPLPEELNSPQKAIEYLKSGADPSASLTAVNATTTVNNETRTVRDGGRGVIRATLKLSKSGFLYLFAARDGDNELELIKPDVNDRWVEAGSENPFELSGSSWDAELPKLGRWRLLALVSPNIINFDLAGWQIQGQKRTRSFPLAIDQRHPLCAPGEEQCLGSYSAYGWEVEVTQRPKVSVSNQPKSPAADRPKPQAQPDRGPPNSKNNDECAQIMVRLSMGGENTSTLTERAKTLGCR